MTSVEIRAGTSLAGIFGLRMLGLFLILPVFALHAPTLKGGEDLMLVGIALGAYGLAQAFLQIPFGVASDRWGRKPVLVIGLIVFALGSFIAAAATDIWITIVGRVVQGAGAISSVVVALAADLTREQHRGKVMAMIGATIGLTFAVSLVAAPVLYERIGMAGLFGLTGVLALAAIWVVASWVPNSPVQRVARPLTRADAAAILTPDLLRLNAGIFALHLVQMAMFVVIPPRLVEAGLGAPLHWQLYLPVVLASFVLMAPPVFYADRYNRAKPVMIGAICTLVIAEALLGMTGSSMLGLSILLLAFFAAFNTLEALIPSLVTRIAPAQARGAAIGVYNTTQTLGLFFGGLAGGWVAGRFGPDAVFWVCAAVAVLWLAIALGMATPRAAVNEISSVTFSIPSDVDIEGLREALVGVRGVCAAEVVAAERVARVTVIPGQWDEGRVRKLIMGEV